MLLSFAGAKHVVFSSLDQLAVGYVYRTVRIARNGVHRNPGTSNIFYNKIALN
eukprot:SAG31_NODE_40441_length_280_cov_9.441989_1_plen_52_part_01